MVNTMFISLLTTIWCKWHGCNEFMAQNPDGDVSVCVCAYVCPKTFARCLKHQLFWTPDLAANTLSTTYHYPPVYCKQLYFLHSFQTMIEKQSLVLRELFVCTPLNALPQAVGLSRLCACGSRGGRASLSKCSRACMWCRDMHVMPYL